jgi:hypothetical protein
MPSTSPDPRDPPAPAPGFPLPGPGADGAAATTDAAPSAAPPIEPSRRGWRRKGFLGAAAAVLLISGVVVTWAVRHGSGADVRDGTTVVDAEGMAQRYGISIKLVGVTALGGAIDFRYQVIDPDKASPILHETAMLPKVIVEKTGESLQMASPPHNHDTELELGGTYFFLLANTHNAVHRGSLVTVVIGDARQEHIVAGG